MILTCFDVIELIGELKSLKSRIAELEAENIRLGIEYQRMRLALGDIAINSKRALKESPTDQLTAHSDIERQDDKSSNDTQTDTFVYGKDSKQIPCPFCGEIVKECNDVATAELEALVERLIEAGDRLSDSLCIDPEEEKTVEVMNWNAIVKERER